MSYSTNPTRQEAELAAFWAGRNSWYPGERIPTSAPYADKGLAAHWRRGLRQVLAEENLDRDTSWDGE